MTVISAYVGLRL